MKENRAKRVCYPRERQCAIKENYPLDWLDLNLDSPHTFTPFHPFLGLAQYGQPILGTGRRPTPNIKLFLYLLFYL